jgi:GNAT superfamily N-acetyltransferase
MKTRASRLIMHFTIRQAEASDLEVISDILLEAVRWMTATGTSVWTVAEVSSAAIERDVVAGEYYLLVNGEQAAATFLLQDADAYYWPDAQANEALYLHKIAVRRTNSGQGHTRTILDYAVAKAEQKGLQYVRLDCNRDRQALNTLYSKLGFELHSSVDIEGYEGYRYQLDVMPT